MKYENSKLSELFPPTTGYYFEKIHDAIRRPEFFGFGKMHVDLISEIVEKFKAALEERGLWENSDSVKYHYENIAYPIEQALVFFEDRNSSKLNDKDVEIFISYIRKELDTLKTIADEIDEEYSTPITRPEPKDETERFISYFNEQLRWIGTIHSRLNQKILLSCLLDTVANARFPDSQNKKRITEFLIDCCNWGDAKRVSVPQLLLVLKRKNQEKGKLFAHLKGIMDSWVKGDILCPDNDPTLDSLMEIAVEGEKVFVEEKSYQNLFYTYRNHLVHNFREPGYGMEISRDGDSPYYHSMSKSTDSDEFNWQLVFPVEFFQRLCRVGLISLEKYLRENNINPYDLYPFGEEWSKV